MTYFCDNLRHFFWGVSLYYLCELCMSYSYILFRNNRLASPVYYAIFVAAEVVFTAGVVPIARRNWTLGSSTRDLILWSAMCVWCASVWIFIDAACHRMPLADFAAIVNSGVTFVPIITCLIAMFDARSERRYRVNNDSGGGRLLEPRKASD